MIRKKALLLQKRFKRFNKYNDKAKLEIATEVVEILPILVEQINYLDKVNTEMYHKLKFYMKASEKWIQENLWV